MYRDYLDTQGRGWVCRSGRKIVGFAYASRDDASIWALFVQPGYERRGIARRLMALAERWLLALGAPAITLDTGRACCTSAWQVTAPMAAAQNRW